MFDLSIPLMFNCHLGNAVLSVADSINCWLVQLCNGMNVSNLLELWQEEVKSVLSGARESCLFPVQIRYDWKNRIGCTRGLFLLKKDKHIYLSDVAEISESFLRAPCEWWECVNPQKAFEKDVMGPISVVSLAKWADRLGALIYANNCSIETHKYYRDTRKRNSVILKNTLANIAGGKELISIFPHDYMKRMKFIRRDENDAEGFGIGWEAGDFEFDGVRMSGEREYDALAWWVKNEINCNRAVSFLCPHKIGRDAVSIFLIKPGDDVASVLPEALSGAKLDSYSLDCIIFSLNNGWIGLPHQSGKIIVSTDRFSRCVKNVVRVALGIIGESAWAEFAVLDNARFTCEE